MKWGEKLWGPLSEVRLSYWLSVLEVGQKIPRVIERNLLGGTMGNYAGGEATREL